MPGINLVINQFIQRQSPSSGAISLQKSNAHHVTEIPYKMANYTPLIDYLSTFVPSEWNTQIETLLQAERDIMKQRQALMASFKEQLSHTLPPHIAQFKIDYPEMFL